MAGRQDVVGVHRGAAARLVEEEGTERVVVRAEVDEFVVHGGAGRGRRVVEYAADDDVADFAFGVAADD